MSTNNKKVGPHQDQPLFTRGPDPEDASAAVIMLHGRGARAQNMLELATEIDVDDIAYLAPQAERQTWYPKSFLAPLESNEPKLSSGLTLVGSLFDELKESGIPSERVVLLGFSQGACLASEFIARNARRYGGLIVLSGGLIGPDETARNYDGSLEDTPIFLGCSDRDPHIPLDRVHESTEEFDGLGADVTESIYEGMGHTIIQDEIDNARKIIRKAEA